jgi:WD40 repeat protein
MSTTQSHHSIDDLLVEISKYVKNPTKTDLNKLLLNCHSFIHSKGIHHQDTQKLATKLATMNEKIITKKQIDSLFDAESEDILSLHFKEQRTTKEQKENYKKMIKQKAKTNLSTFPGGVVQDDFDLSLQTPITPSSPRFVIYYDFVYIPELVSHIFQFLETSAQCKMKRVCHLWSAISDDELLWKLKYLDSYTIHKGDENYKKDSSIIKFIEFEKKKNKIQPIKGQHGQFKNWRDLCVMSEENENRHWKSQKPIIINSVSGESNNSYDHYNRLFCCRFSQDGNYLISGGQSSTVQVLKTCDLLKNSVEEYDSSGDEEEKEDISTHRTLLEFLQGRIRMSNVKKDKRPKERIKIHSKIPANDVGWSVLDVDISKDNKYVTYSTWKNYVPLIQMENPSKRTEIELTGL